jgi:hypothetical protein
MRQVMGPEDILISDVGAHKMWIARHYHCDRPNTCLISNGFAAMGMPFLVRSPLNSSTPIAKSSPLLVMVGL